MAERKKAENKPKKEIQKKAETGAKRAPVQQKPKSAKMDESTEQAALENTPVSSEENKHLKEKEKS